MVNPKDVQLDATDIRHFASTVVDRYDDIGTGSSGVQAIEAVSRGDIQSRLADT